MDLIKLFAIVITAFLISCSGGGDQTAGTVDSSETGVLTTVFYPNGAPASGVTVSLYHISEKENRPVAEVTTDEKGQYSFKSVTENIPDGKYNIIAMTAEVGVYRDSVLFENDTTAVTQDTLRNLGIVSGFVKVQVNHSPQTVTIHILGTGVNNTSKLNVSKEGFFTFPELAPGTYSVEFLSTEENYTPTYESIEVTEAVHDTLAEPIELIYTGIPVIQQMALSYDTIMGEVDFSWKPSNYEFIQRYLVERKEKDAIEWDTIATIDVNGEKHDSSFVDLPFKNSSETESFTLQYRVRIEDKQGIPGNPFGYAEITVPNPKSVQTVISTETNGTTFSINDTVHLKAVLTNPTKEIRSVRWFSEEFSLDSTSNHSDLQVISEVKVILTSVGTKEFTLSTIDENGIETAAAISVEVQSDAPRIIHISDSIRFSGDSLYVYAEDTYGEVVEYEWKTSESEEFISTGNSAHFPLVSDTLFIEKPVTVRVTDNDGESATKEVLVTYKPEWRYFNYYNYEETAKLFSIDNFIIEIRSDALIYLSADCKAWETTGETVPFPVADAKIQMLRFRDDFWVLSTSSSKSELWKSRDFINWELAKKTNNIGSTAPVLFIFQDQLYSNINDGSIGEFHATKDGIEWILSPGNITPAYDEFLTVTTDESTITLLLNRNGIVEAETYNSYMIKEHTYSTELPAENFSCHPLDSMTIIHSGQSFYYSDNHCSQPPKLFSSLILKNTKPHYIPVLHKKRFYLFSNKNSIFTNR